MLPIGFEETTVVEPVDPFEGGELHGLHASPGAAPMDDLGLEQAVDGFGERIVIAVADAADRGLDAGTRKPFGIADRDILHAAIAVVDETAFAHGTPVVKRLLERIQDEVRPCRTRRTMRRANASITKAT